MATAQFDSLMKELAACGARADGEIDLARTALILGALNHPGLSLDRYEHHLEKLPEDVAACHRALIAAGAKDDLQTRRDALKKALTEINGYSGEPESGDVLESDDLVRVIERRRGSAAALGILCLHAARALGWRIHGLNFPMHFVLRLDDEAGQRLIFDPGNACAVLQAADLRSMIKESLGEKAELSTGYFEPLSNRAILVGMQNTLKLRRVGEEDYEGALRTVEALRALDPGEFRLLLDAGVLYSRTGRAREAVVALEGYIRQAPKSRDRQEAALLLQHIRKTLV